MHFLTRITTTTALILLTAPGAFAQFECGGSLKQENFHPEMKKLNKEIQGEILEYRRLERDTNALEKGSEEESKAKAKLATMKEGLKKRKETFQALNSPNFPRTQLSAYGIACNDRRWVDKAKLRLIEKPQNMGGHYHVWMDKKTHDIKVSRSRPAANDVAAN